MPDKSDMPIAVRRLEGGEEEVGQTCIATFWRHDHILARNREFFTWQFTPPALENGLGFWIASCENRIVGCMGDVALDCHLHGQAFPGSTVMHTFVLPEFRRFRIGLRFMGEIYRNRGLVIGMFGTPVITAIYRQLGQYVLDSFPRFAGIVDEGRFERVLASARGRKTVMDEYATVPRVRSTIREVRGYTVKEIREEDAEEWDFAWSARFASRMRGVVKDGRFIAWRYMRHPVFPYRVLTVYDSRMRMQGLAVIRIADLPGSLSAVRILEFFAGDETAGAALAAGVQKHFPENAAYVECSCFGEWWRPLEAIGMGDATAAPISIYYNPPNCDFTAITAAFHVALPGSTPEAFMTGAGTYVSMGDSDTDVPN